MKMQDANQFQDWTSTGFFEGTIMSVIIQSLNDSLDVANRSVRDTKADLARTHLIEQQLMLQVHPILHLFRNI